MEKIRRKGKAEGSVLFTVVSVMMVMVVFLMSTLVLTTSANRRSYYTYYENQAQYTAQGVLDAISNTAYTNPDFHEWVTSLTGPGEINVNIDQSNIPLTRGGSAVSAFVEPITDNYIWDQETGAIRCQKGWKITVTASVGQGKNASESTMANYIYENFRNPIVSSTENRASWVNALALTVSSSNNPGSPNKGTGNKAKAMYTGSGASFFSGNNLLCLGPQTFGITKFPKGFGGYDTDTNVNQFTNQSTTVGDGIFVGNFSTNDKIYFDFQKPGEGVQFWGNFEVTNYASFLSDLNVMTPEYRYIPYIYCDGNLKFHESTDAKVGGSSNNGEQPVNIYTNQITNAPSQMMGDIYIFNPNADSTLHSNIPSTLARFIGDQVQKTNTTLRGYNAGDIIANSKSLTIDKHTAIDGDIIFTNPNGTLTITANSGPLEIGGAILCAGKLVLNGSDKGITVAGGVYANSSTAQISGTINGMNSPSLEEICDSSSGYFRPQIDANTGGWTAIENNSKSAQFESLGMNGASAESYDALVTKLLTGHLGGGPAYDPAYTGPDYSMFPFCSRQDEIFTQYLRWDLAAATQADAKANRENDPLVKESEACGHTWGEYLKHSDNGDTWVPGTVPIDVTEIDSNKAKVQNSNCFIPPLDTTNSSTLGVEYENDFASFVSKHSITKNETLTSLTKKNITFYSHDKDGANKKIELGSVPVVTDNCILDLANNNQAYTVFVDPTAAGHNSNNPLCIVLSGSFDNAPLTIVVNNSGTFDSQNTWKSYAQISAETTNPQFAGRADVLFFLRDNIFATKTFRITSTGCYQQMVVDRDYDVISNPDYPGFMQQDGTLALSAAWLADYNAGKKDAFKFEMVPNSVVYGQKNFDYGKGHINPWDPQHPGSCFPNGSSFNAEVFMPDSVFASPSGERECYAKGVTYREFPDSIAYDAYHSDDKLIMTLGTLFVKDLDVKNVPLCVYLGDLGRPSVPPTTTISTNGTTRENDTASNIVVNANNDFFSNDHQNHS